jgi:hypothetical protein
MLAGKMLFAHLYDRNAAIIMGRTGVLLAVLLLGLSVMCVSVYLQGALGRFEALLRQSLPFLFGSIASVPLALWIGGQFRARTMCRS